MWECSGLTEEQYNQFRAQFLSLDQNKDGLITVEEVQQVMAGAGLVCRLEEINRMMETCDRNKDGHCSWSEYLGLMLILLRRQVEQDTNRRAFTLADTNKDGRVTLQELSQFFKIGSV